MATNTYETATTAQRLAIVNQTQKLMHKPMQYKGEDFIPLMVSFLGGVPVVTMSATAIPKDKVTIRLEDFMAVVEQ